MIWWMEKKNLSKKELLILAPNQGVLKNEEKQSHFGFINKILRNFQPVKFMIYFKLTILWRKKQKYRKGEINCVYFWGEITEDVFKRDRLRLLSAWTKGTVFCGGYAVWFWLYSVCVLKIHPCLLPSSWIIMAAAWISRFEAITLESVVKMA